MSTSPEASKYFNYSTEVGSNSDLSGYLVDKNGEIDLPIVGQVKLSGLNSSDARDTVAQKLAKYLIEPSVKLTIRNFRVTILGDVMRPGVYAVPNEKMTLPEALALSGDLTMFSERDKVTIIRDSLGYKSYGEVSLTTREIFTSGYYNLHANDILYIKPSRKKRYQGENFYRTVPFYLSAFSFALTLVTIFKD
jgi:polysaccharide export outer membrane protein